MSKSSNECNGALQPRVTGIDTASRVEEKQDQKEVELALSERTAVERSCWLPVCDADMEPHFVWRMRVVQRSRSVVKAREKISPSTEPEAASCADVVKLLAESFVAFACPNWLHGRRCGAPVMHCRWKTSTEWRRGGGGGGTERNTSPTRPFPEPR